MVGGWAFDGSPRPVGAGTVTIVEGSSFAIFTPTGDIDPGSPHGLFYRDTRILSTWQIRVDGAPIESLSVMPAEPFHATLIGRCRPRPGQVDSTLILQRDRYVGSGMREDLVLRNLSAEASGATLTIAVDADFADLFAVKENRAIPWGEHAISMEDDNLRIQAVLRDQSRGIKVSADGGGEHSVLPNLITFRIVVPARGQWQTSLLVTPLIDDVEAPTAFPERESVEVSEPAKRLREWRRAAPLVVTEHEGLAATLRCTERDLGSLRIFDPGHPELAVIAAGAPWFMALFGRDSLLTSWMSLPLDQSLALGTLRTLARFQGVKVDPLTEEEPGRILHEMRAGPEGSLVLGSGHAYYGSVDATPLFVMLLGELRRWGLATDDVNDLLPHADRALEWIEKFGDRDGDGFVEYRRATDQGLANQGWKDSFDGITFADGTIATPPIALAEVQGYVYAAFVARMHFAREANDLTQELHWATKAAALKTAFNEQFWLPDRGYYALALDRDKKPVDSLASNMAHCLWTGIADEDKAAQVAEHLLSPELFTGWGIRTLATNMGAYNPMSYHNGSVWPHDNALAVAGLVRYGHVEKAQRVTLALLDAAMAFGGRLPELLCGFDRREYALPVPYPTSCSPQAWASATPIHLIRTLMRFDPALPAGRLWFSPVLPPELLPLRVERVPLGGSRVNLVVDSDGARVDWMPDGIELMSEPRSPLMAELS